MPNTVIRGVVRGGVVVLHDAETLPVDGTEVLVSPAIDPPGTPKAVLDSLRASPPVASEWVDDLEQIIAQGRRPTSRMDPFENEAGDHGSP